LGQFASGAEIRGVEIAEIWSDHGFLLKTCCAARHEQLLAEMTDDPEWATELLRHLGAEELTGFRLRRLYDDQCSPPVLDFRLTIEPVRFTTMHAFVRAHHVHCPPPVTWRFGAAIFNGRTRIGVVSVANPVARAYVRRGWVEVNRLCIRRDTPAAAAMVRVLAALRACRARSRAAGFQQDHHVYSGR